MGYTPEVVVPGLVKLMEQENTKSNVKTSKANKKKVVTGESAPASEDKEETAGSDDDEGVPSSIADEYSRVQELYFFPLEDAREELYKAFHSDKTAESTLSILAKRVASRTFALQNFWDRYHLAVDIDKGKDVLQEEIDRLENVRKKYASAVSRSERTPQRELSSYTKSEIDVMIKTGSIPSYITSQGLTIGDIRKERVKRDVKYLRRNDRKAGSDYTVSLREAATELHEWGEKITEAMERSCALYGYTIPSDWVTRPLTQEERAYAKNEANKRRYAEKTKTARDLRNALLEEQESMSL